MAPRRPHTVVADIVLVAPSQDIVRVTAGDAPGTVLAVGAPSTETYPHGARPEVEPVLRGVLPLAGTFGVVTGRSKLTDTSIG